MPRNFGGLKCPEKPRKEELHSDSITNTYEIQVITPIFGGGVEAGVNDPITPIRPSSIRGHLRFWWRATRGARCKTVADLRQREGEIWGTTDNPSNVVVEVSVRSKGKSYYCADLGRKGRYIVKREFPSHVLFPFQGNIRKNEKPAECTPNIFFCLRLTHPKVIYQDVDAAVWAWINFGGIGARTRRGCCALYCLDPNDQSPPSCQGLKKWLKERISYYGLTFASESQSKVALEKSRSIKSPLLPSRKWATLGRILIKMDNNMEKDPILFWKYGIEVMRELRQGIKGRDNGASTNPGQSRWPEAESIRKLVVAQRDIKSRPSTMHPEDTRKPGIAFPRVEFGMPIILDLRKDYINHSVNIKPTLQPSDDHDRMATPIILRPIKFGDNSFASIILRLNKPPLQSAYLKPGDKDLVYGRSIPSSEIRIENYTDSPFAHPSKPSFASALDVFMSFAESRGFVEVFP
ncbi:CRISPR system Cmr subunit Cmr1-2 [uncultured archaeon]|nr:CRISPR system Cmr subunit Cmr1-2 [uncultured archaeon]